MITGANLWTVVTAMVPLYVAMGLGYGSVRWWSVFNADQCAGINRFVAIFAVPLLSLWFIHGNNPYKMDREFLLADAASKGVALAALAAWWWRRRRLDWVITSFSLSTLPNTLVMGIPLLDAMYGPHYSSLMVQIVVLQSLIWYTFLLFLFELRAATSRPSMRLPMPTVMPPIPLDNMNPDDLQVQVSSTCKNGSVDLEVLVSQEEPTNLNHVIAEVEPSEDQVELNHAIAEVGVATEHGNERRLKAMNVLKVVVWKLARNPNTYATLVGIVWSLIAFKYNIGMPKIVQGSIQILSQAGLGMAMFSLGLFMALQPKLIPCGTRLCILAMVMRFLVGPMLMAATSVAIGLHGVQLRAAIVQAALPQGIVPFVFAREYNLHPDILSTAVVFGMLVALPIMLLYYFILEI